MRQIKSCKVGHFVKYNDVLCQVNCFYTSMGEKHATLIQVAEPEESKTTVHSTGKREGRIPRHVLSWQEWRNLGGD